jgi:hypothetical protein
VLDGHAVIAAEAVEAVEPAGQTFIQFYRASALHDALARQRNPALMRFFYHDVHIGQDFVHMLFLGVAVGEPPEIRGLHADARNELIFLHILCAKRAVEVIEYRRNRSFSSQLRHLRSYTYILELYYTMSVSNFRRKCNIYVSRR